MTAPVQLIQFARWPLAGQVKTRLEPALGRDGALAAHIRLTLTVLERLTASGHPVAMAWDRALVLPPDAAAPILDAMDRFGVSSWIQQGRDLGERMTSALTEGLMAADIAMVIGSDCPSVDAAYIAQAQRTLQQAEVVFGPSDDGGYVLIGARRTRAAMLEQVEWGSGRALAQSITAVRGAGLSVTTLEPRWDVDEPADWDRFLSMMAQSPTGG